MPAMWHHFISLLVRSWNAMTSSTSTNTLGFILWTIAVTAVLWLAAVGADWWKLRKKHAPTAFREAFAGSFVSGLFSAIGVTVLVLIIWGWFIMRTIFDDHQYFVAKTKELSQVRQELTIARAKLLATPYRGDRHLSGEQENTLYLALRDIAVKVPESRRIIYMGFIDGDKDSQRFVDLFLWPNFEKAGWKMRRFTRSLRHKDSDLQLPGFSYADVSITSTLIYTKIQHSEEWKEQESQMEGLLGAIRVLEQAHVTTGQGLVMDERDPLKNKSGFIVWVNPKQDGPK